ncbi:MAG: hypothetical protein M1830_000028 [Pleopsidium flavum]|nr:MAG: hypothetical protein M1830_000028 [Pleopsidium flavum]
MSEASATWSPPAAGSPVWIEIPALDVERAKQFYTAVFAWTFQPGTDDYPENKLAMFAYPGSKVSGGIAKVEDDAKRETMRQAIAAGKSGKCPGGMLTFFYVESIEEALEKVEKAGGRIVKGKEMEGKHGWHAVFADTEGNPGAVYKWKEM